MDDAFQAILDSLPPKPARSKLEPYVELIQELRKRGRSYREIAGILSDRCGVKAGTHTVYNFVRVRTQVQKKAKPTRTGTEHSSQASSPSVPTTATTPSAEGNDEVWQRIQALKQRTAQREGAEKKEFAFDENEPLQLISDSKPKQ